MDWQELKEQKMLDPKTPAEYAEATRRMLLILINDWDDFKDGDGESSTPDDEPQTKTDMFHIISGCCGFACDCIKDFQKFEQTFGSPDHR